MPRLLYLSSATSDSPEEEHLFNYLTGWDVIYVSSEIDSIKRFSYFLKEKEIHFIVFNLSLSQEGLHLLSELHHSFPLVPTIFYAAQMNSKDFQILQRIGIKHCVVGDGRQVHLIKTLWELWKHHWKRIPDHLLPENRTSFVKNVIEIIQNEPIRNFNIRFIARELNQTDDQFREQFKKQFNLNFRKFKQALLDHYETYLLFKKGFKPGKIYAALNYQNLSAFSRSFRIRHGASWQAVMRRSNGVQLSRTKTF